MLLAFVAAVLVLGACGSTATTASGGEPSGDPTTAWFTAFCKTLTSIELNQLFATLAVSDVPNGSATLRQISDGLTNGASNLQTLAPPAVEGGDKFAPEAAAALSSYGKVLADTAEKYGSADNDDSARRSIVLNMTDDIQNQTAQLRDTYGPAPAAVSAAYHSTPACKGFPFNF